MSTACANDASAATPATRPWDEMATGRGGLRPGWGGLLASLAALGPEVVSHRVGLLDRMLTEDGVSGLLPGAAPGAWRCDPMPVLLGAAEFDRLAAGLRQRARLIEMILDDVYGKQRLLASGALPPGLVFANPAFLRPCRDVEGDRKGPRMQVYAAELVRGPDGVWRVLADRTADAAGVAYARENRRALVRALPELFRAYLPRGLTPFFEAWQDALHRLAPPGTDQPGIALLTPGSSDKLWFEHVVLARELSCTLVEGGDLTARDGALYLKTLSGLRQIHVLVRRQDGRTLDPLELEPWPRLGVTGLLDAVRAGSIRIVNDPGTGCAEAPAWTAVLAKLANKLLGEALSLPSVESHWLGDPAAFAQVMPELDRWRIRPSLDGTVAAIEPGRLPAEERARLADRIAAAPGDFVATAPVTASLAPCLGRDGLEPRPVIMRMFLMFDGREWHVLPGGLARAVGDTDLVAGRLPLHAMCKDVWVSSEDQDEIVGPAAHSGPALPIRRDTGDLPSRVADNFYWLGRYLERLEAAARVLRSTLARLERPGSTPRESAELRSLAACLVAVGLIEREAAQGLGPAALRERLRLVAQPKAELPYLVGEISQLAQLLRDRLTRELHSTFVQGLRNIGQALAQLRQHEGPQRTASPREIEHLAAMILNFAAAIAGLAAENMVRSGGRLFLDLGRRVERAWATARSIAYALDQQGAALQPARLEPGLRLALELCDSVITYRSRYLNNLQLGPVLDLVLADEGNPRAVAFQLAAIRDVLAELARDPAAPLPASAAALLRDAGEVVRDVALAPEQQFVASLPARLRAIEEGVTELSDRITRHYFSVLPPLRGLGVAEETGELRGMA